MTLGTLNTEIRIYFFRYIPSADVDERRSGIYAQDSWTLGRFSINPGIRFEHFNSSIEATGVGAGRFVPARQFSSRSDVPDCNDVSPRFGFAWDVKGDGRTAVKVGTGKYMRAYSLVPGAVLEHRAPTEGLRTKVEGLR